MDDVRVPESAVGRVGMVAMLQRVRPEAVGRLVALRHPVGMMSTLGDSPRSVFAWQALILGEPIEIEGRPQAEIIIADRCLVPVSLLTSTQVERLLKAQAMSDAAQALADLKQVLNGRELSPQILERAIVRAAEFSAIRLALQVAPVATALREIGFRSLHEGSSVWQWSGMHQGTELAVTARPGLFDQWQIVGKRVTADKRMWDERLLPAMGQRGATALMVLRLWRAAFGEASPPGCLGLGVLYERHRRDIDRMQLGRPTLLVDGEGLRGIRRRLARDWGQQEGEVGPLPDEPLALSFRDEMLRFEVRDQVFACQTRGMWVDDCVVSMREFIALSPWRLRGESLSVQREADVLRISAEAVQVLNCQYGHELGASAPRT